MAFYNANVPLRNYSLTHYVTMGFEAEAINRPDALPVTQPTASKH